jgi:hypothetical protein
MDIKLNVEQIKQEIEKLRTKLNITYKIKICAATKYVKAYEINLLLDAGIKDLGENRVQDFLVKAEALKERDINWHFIGHLQTNKVKSMINKIKYLHSLDRESLAKAVNKYRSSVLECYVEVNCSKEESKHGLAEDEVIPFIKDLAKYDKIKVIGLMTMAENTSDKNVIRSNFQLLKKLQQEVEQLNLPYAPCKELSMGMSNDFIIAIEEGATIVRIGSRLFK